MPLVYLGHAVGHDPVRRAENILRVQRWFKWLIDYGPESWSFGVPWLIYTLNLDEGTYRERGIRDDMLMLATFDIICLVGGQRTIDSQGAQAEKLRGFQLRKGICDLTFLGEEPPTSETWSASDPYDEPPMSRDSVTQLILSHLKC